MAFQIPADLDPSLVALAWLIGHWARTGNGTWTGRGDFSYGCRIDFADNGGPYLHYLCQMFELDEDGSPLRPLSMETGFWRPQPDASLEVVMAHPDGYAEVWFGSITGAKIELTTDAVARTLNAADSYTGGHRLYGQVDGDLLFTVDRATEDHQLQNYLWARLRRAG